MVGTHKSMPVRSGVGTKGGHGGRAQAHQRGQKQPRAKATGKRKRQQYVRAIERLRHGNEGVDRLAVYDCVEKHTLRTHLALAFTKDRLEIILHKPDIW